MINHIRRFKRIVTVFAFSIGFSTSVLGQTPALDDLFNQLRTADSAELEHIQVRIYEEWSKSGSPLVDLLLRRGQKALTQGDFLLAVKHFSAVIDHAPDFAEGYNGRATAFYHMQRYGESIEDIRQTLLRNPRHFGAITGLGMIFEELDEPERALQAYRRVKALAPAMPNMHEAINRLQKQLTGQSL